MPLSSVTDRNLEKFIKSFVSIFEQSLLSYYKNLVEKVPKAGKWAELVNWIIRVCTAGSGVTDYKAAIRVSLALPLISLVLSEAGIRYNRKKLLKLIKLLDIYHENEENKIKIRTSLIETGMLIFRSFEIKFMEATVHNSQELAMLKLARDASDRIFNFFYEHSELLKEEDFFLSQNLIKATILGKSKRRKSIFTIPNVHLGYSLDRNLTTKRLYEQTPILKLVSQDEHYCYKPNKNRVISDFRLLFQWEEEKEDDAINTLNQWGSDHIIVLFKNRLYRKADCITKTSINRLSIAQLTEEECQEKTKKILNEINTGNKALENTLKIELEAIKGHIKYDVINEITKLEKELTDIKAIMIITLNRLALLEEGQETLQKKILPFNERKYSFGETIQIALEISEIPSKQLTERVCFESILERLKTHLSTQTATNEQDFYIPLEGYYDTLISQEPNKFQLLNKVIDFIQNPNKKILLTLGESGSGKTFFSSYLANYLLEFSMLSKKNRPILPFYIRVSCIDKKNMNTLALENLLKCYYHFNSEEIEFLLINQKLICFILDDMNDLDINLNFISELYNKFTASHCIFMASLSKLKLVKNHENLFTSQHICDVKKLKSLQEKTIHLAAFDEVAIKNYIRCFIEKNKDLESDLKEVEIVYQRIKAIQNLSEIVKQPILLMITMQVLPYLEAFYRQQKVISEFESIQKDLYHMYTHRFYSKAAKKIKEKKGIMFINEISIYDCILTYSIKLAQLMRETGIIEIDEHQIFGNKTFFPETASSSTSDQANLSKFTFRQHSEYIKLFSKRYNSHIFRDGNEFKLYKYGRKGCEFISINGSFNNISYRFKHDTFLNYFFTLSDNIQDEKRRNKIQAFIENIKISGSQKKESYVHFSKKLETRSTLKQGKTNFFADTTKTVNYSNILYEEPSTSYPVVETSVESSLEIG